ncbi:MAG: LysR family transcriptional regulator, partial [Clostridia bacterium]|nr:LysR family transcriptional regulator [Clostridia bacterium]
AGVGVAFWPEFSWGQMENTENIRLLRIKNPDCRREIITYLSEDGSETAEAFYDFMVERLKNKGERLG